MKKRVAVLISGRGSNMASLLAACVRPDYPAAISLVVSNRADAPGLTRAGATATAIIDHRQFDEDRAAHERAVDAALTDHGIELVCLAGYMRRLSPYLVERWAGRMLNIHPSLLPSFPGLKTHARALSTGVRLHGCTVHYVTNVVDEGPIIAQAAVPVLPDDDETTLASRVLAEEHGLYPLALALVAGSSVSWAAPNAALRNPLPPPVGPF